MSDFFCFFDLDGTILHLNGDWDKVHEMVKPFIHVVAAAQDAKKKNDTAFFEKLSQLELVKAPTPLFGLKILRNLKCPVFIISNNTNQTVKECIKMFDMPVVDSIGLESVNEPKPSPEGAQLLLKQYNLNPKNGLFLGNNPDTDEKAAKAAGIAFINIKDLHDL